MKSTTFGLNSQKLADLIRLGMNGDSSDPEENPEDHRRVLFQAWMQEKLPLEALPTKTSPSVGSGNVLSMEQQLQLPLSQLLNSGIDLEVLMALKDFAKRQVNQAGQPDVRDVATVFYYASIACALVEHQQMITSASKDRLARALKTLLSKSWIGDDIRALLEKAMQQCR